MAILTNSPLHHFEYAACINLDSEQQKWQAMHARFNTLGTTDKVKRFSIIAALEFHHIGHAHNHRKIVAHAKKFGYKNVLVFDDHMAECLVDNHGIDQYFYYIDTRYMVRPKLFTQPSLQKSEDEPCRYFYK